MRSLDVQAYGTATVIIAFGLAEMSAYLLQAHPGSALAWYLNIELFRPFEIARGQFPTMDAFFRPASLPVAIVLLALILLARRLAMRLVVAAGANLGFMFVLVVCAATVREPRRSSIAALDVVPSPDKPGAAMILFLLLGSFTCALLAHASFLHRILRAWPPSSSEHTGRGHGGSFHV